MATSKTSHFWMIPLAALIGAAALYLFTQNRDNDTVQPAPIEPPVLSEAEQPSLLPDTRAEPEEAILAMPAAPWMRDNAVVESTPATHEAPPARNEPQPARQLPDFNMSPTGGDDTEIEAELNEARQAIQALRESHGSETVGNIRLDVLEKNLDVAERLNAMAMEMQQFQQANPNIDPTSPEFTQRLDALNELAGKLDMNFMMNQNPLMTTQKK